MSQLNTHKAPSRSEKQTMRGRAAAKASGDATTRCKKDNRSKSRSSKIPKNLRYELENALVGLCDVWFEEIKPHLIRNKIKLHINDAGAGDHDKLPAGAPGCSHLDPGAASDTSYREFCTHRSRRRPQPPADWRVPRICRTYSVLSNSRTIERTSKHFHSNYRRPKYRRKKNHADKSTQTDISQLCLQHQSWAVKSAIIRPFAKEKSPLHAKINKLESPKLSKRRNQIDDSKLDSPYQQGLRPSPSHLGKTLHKRSFKLNEELEVKLENGSPWIEPKKTQNVAGGDKRTGKILELLYENPTEDHPNSMMNLVMSVNHRQKSKKKPWR